MKYAGLNTQTRIVGGYITSIDKAPWTVVIIYDKVGYNTLCGGSIISRSKILSAAHCTYGYDKEYFLIRAGSSRGYTGGQVREVDKIINHPNYRKDKFPNDLSILVLKKSLQLSTSVAIIGIDKKPLALRDGTEIVAFGWGKTCDDFDPKCNPSEILRTVKLPIIGNRRCRKMYKVHEKFFTIKNSMLCAGLRGGGRDTCSGDSGGPAIFNNTLVGIVSFGVGCAQPNSPGVYTRVAFFRNWIKQYL